jgi:hypothetical protein
LLKVPRLNFVEPEKNSNFFEFFCKLSFTLILTGTSKLNNVYWVSKTDP